MQHPSKKRCSTLILRGAFIVRISPSRSRGCVRSASPDATGGMVIRPGTACIPFRCGPSCRNLVNCTGECRRQMECLGQMLQHDDARMSAVQRSKPYAVSYVDRTTRESKGKLVGNPRLPGGGAPIRSSRSKLFAPRRSAVAKTAIFKSSGPMG